jgi:hypothetical protein
MTDLPSKQCPSAAMQPVESMENADAQTGSTAAPLLGTAAAPDAQCDARIKGADGDSDSSPLRRVLRSYIGQMLQNVQGIAK